MAGMRQRLSKCLCASVVALTVGFAGPGVPRAFAQTPLVVNTQLNYFTVNGVPKFLVFYSYFDALRASDPTLNSDFAYLKGKGIDGIRILPNWLNWGTPPTPAGDTLIDPTGALRPATLTRFLQVLTLAKAYGLLVDVSFTCDTVPGLNHTTYKNGIVATTNAIAGDDYRHVIFDLQNESNYLSCGGVGSPTSDAQRLDLRNAVKAADPMRLVTASLVESNNVPGMSSEAEVNAMTDFANLDIVAYHDPRYSNWYDLTDDVVYAFAPPQNCLDPGVLADIANNPGSRTCTPIYLQEPSYTAPTSQAYIDAVKNAKAAGAAAWCFHTEKAFDLDPLTTQAQLTVTEQGFMNGFKTQLDAVAWEGSNMMSTWRTFFGVPNVAGGDADGDGINNVTEFLNGTHPNGNTGLTRSFVEGLNDTFWGTRVALVNPGPSTAAVLVTFTRDNGTKTTAIRSLASEKRGTVDVPQVPGMRISSFRTTVETTQRVAAERTIYWDRVSAYGAHSDRGLTSASPFWYFAEGSTAGAFDVYYHLYNPNAFAITAQVKYTPSGGGPFTYTYNVPANGRRSISVDGEPGLSGLDFGASLSASGGHSFFAERGMFYTSEGRAFNAGNGSVAMKDPWTTWIFAEGSTGGFFDTFFLILNPTASTASVTANYRLPGGTTVTRAYSVPPNSRYTISADADPGLVNTSFWTTFTSNVNVVVERTIWFPDGIWRESVNTPGESGGYPNWALAEGEQGFAQGAATYLSIANTSGFADTVQVKVLVEGGSTLTQNFVVGALSRLTVDIGVSFPGAANQRFGTLVRSLGGAQVVAERVTYWNANGLTWAVGTGNMGTRF
jgi:hypothetical protein